jgi:hypothetical protein
LHLKASSPHKRCFHQLETPSTLCHSNKKTFHT